MTSWHLHRDGGEWSGYEGTADWQTQFRTREALEAEIRRRQTQELEAAKVAQAAAERRVREAEGRLAKPVKIRGLADPPK